MITVATAGSVSSVGGYEIDGTGVPLPGIPDIVPMCHDGDYLQLGGQRYCGTVRPSSVRLEAGATIEWHADSLNRGDAGWTLCWSIETSEPISAAPTTTAPTAIGGTVPPTPSPTPPFRECVDLDVHHDGHRLVGSTNVDFRGCKETVSGNGVARLVDVYQTNNVPDLTGRLSVCGQYDSAGFTAAVSCCACGGGTHTTGVCTESEQASGEQCNLLPHPECSDTAGRAVGSPAWDCATIEQYINSYAEMAVDIPAYDFGLCDGLDDDDFTAREMCCVCGGGQSYIEPERNCDPGNAIHTTECCVCGGGVRPTMSPTAAPTAAPILSPTVSPTSSSPTAAPTAAPTPTPLQSIFPGAAGAAASGGGGGGGGDGGDSTGVIVGAILAVLVLVGLVYIGFNRAQTRQRPDATFTIDDFIEAQRRESTTGMTSVAAYMNLVENPSYAANGVPAWSRGVAALKGATGESEIEIVLPENCAYVQKIVSRKKALLKELTIDPMRLAVGKMVGSGQFGQVFLGSLNPQAVNVAIKMVKGGAGSSAANEELADEAVVTGTFNHPNVIKALGVYQEDTCWRLVLEFCGKGALQTLVSEFATASAAAGQTADGTAVAYGLARLLRYTTELASAMEYLSDLKFVHRDLAARNALVSDDDAAKLADFGMSRQTGASDSYVAVTQRPQPLRWMAPESIELMTFSSETDVWSFGVMAWEVFAMGGQPYQGVSNLMVYKELVVDGTRLECPAGCPDPVYTILATTWLLAPGKRPSFATLHEQLRAVQLDDPNAAALPVTNAALIAVNADYRLMDVGAAPVVCPTNNPAFGQPITEGSSPADGLHEVGVTLNPNCPVQTRTAEQPMHWQINDAADANSAADPAGAGAGLAGPIKPAEEGLSERSASHVDPHVVEAAMAAEKPLANVAELESRLDETHAGGGDGAGRLGGGGGGQLCNDTLADANDALPVPAQPINGDDHDVAYFDPVPIPAGVYGPVRGQDPLPPLAQGVAVSPAAAVSSSDSQRDGADPGNSDTHVASPSDYVNAPPAVRSAKREDRLQQLLGGAGAETVAAPAVEGGPPSTPSDYVNAPPAVRSAKREDRLQQLLGEADAEPSPTVQDLDHDNTGLEI